MSRNQLTTKQVAQRLGVSKRTVINLLERGRFPSAYKVDPESKNSPWIIPTKEVDAFEHRRKNNGNR